MPDQQPDTGDEESDSPGRPILVCSRCRNPMFLIPDHQVREQEAALGIEPLPWMICPLCDTV